MKKSIHQFYQKIIGQDPIEFALKATLVLFLFSEWVTGDEWVYMMPIMILSAFGLMVPGLHKNRIVWYILSIVFILKTNSQWWTQDNHLFVNMYWVITIAFVLSFKNWRQLLVKNSRAIIGLVFLFATIWKVLSPDFMSGSYFHFTFLTDSRFVEESDILGDLSQADLASNIRSLKESALSNEATQAALITNQKIRSVTKLITWHTIIIESLLALLFLLPQRYSITRYRNYLILVFALTTYLVMPIHSFAWLLIAITISQTGEDEKMDRFLLILSLPLMLIYKHIPFMQWIADLI
ncbi:hypothetical protein SAMN05421640_2974 [Ekhidna lutea]|uniref:Uncharacterized protein n=1 Tax=Ekhidna lutea TaxID=447679 RepID=A0A239L494_EKHLU|nr:hypothetical protein [Ekhidna lutea]SNT25427.1 hypothetical protein SAMN05421640_2974 [Ekhidna lutea]